MTTTPDPTEGQGTAPLAPAPADPVAHALALIQRAEALGPWPSTDEGDGDEGGWLLMLADAWSNLLQAAALQRLAGAVECLDRQAHDGSFRVILTDAPPPAPPPPSPSPPA